MIEIRIPADAEWVRVVRLAVAGIASRQKFSLDDIEDIKLAVTEALNNAILHAAAPRDDAHLPLIIVQMTPYGDRLEISVADEGCFKDGSLPRAAMRLVSPHGHSPSELPESGLGLFLMQSLMDSVEHHAGPDHNTIIRMVKYVREPAGAQRDR
jgi:serine/threonine-protein kinase RsbW